MNPSTPISANDLEAILAQLEDRSLGETTVPEFFAAVQQSLQSSWQLRSFTVHRVDDQQSQWLAGDGNPPSFAAAKSPQRAGELVSQSLPAEHGPVLFVEHAWQAGHSVRLLLQPGPASALSERLRDAAHTLTLICSQFLSRTDAAEMHLRASAQQAALEVVHDLDRAEAGDDHLGDVCRVVQRSLGIDRCSLLVVKGSHARLLATSATGPIGRNTTTVRLMERMVGSAARTLAPLNWNIGNGDTTGIPVSGTAAGDYLRESSVRSLTAWWLAATPDSPPVGCLLLEHFSGLWPPTTLQPVQLLVEPRIRAAALRLLERRQASLLTRWAGRTRSWGGRLLLAASVLGISVAALLLIPLELRISAPGTLRPRERRTIFAPDDGILAELAVKHEQQVQAGDVLFVLRNPELDLRRERTLGEAATLRARLEALAAARLRNRSLGSNTAEENDLSATEADLRAQLRGLEDDLRLQEQRRAALTVRSPIAGRVDRWDLSHTLRDRPMTQGEFLLDVQNVAGDWEMELQIPDDAAGIVLQAQRQRPCPVEFALRTNSGRRYLAELREISQASQLGADGQPMVAAIAPVQGVQHDELRVGAGVVARISCGQHSAGYVWFRDVLDFLLRSFWI